MNSEEVMTWLTASAIPEAELSGVTIERFEIPKNSFLSFRYMLEGRPTTPGTYTRLLIDGTLMMSDTPAERNDHFCVLRAVNAFRAKRVLINGLGLGIVVNAVLRMPTVRHVDVVERDERVIALVEPTLQEVARANGKELAVHCADALTKRWPRDTVWQIAWHDIWPSISSDNLPEMFSLTRKYGKLALWQGSWCRQDCLEMRAEERELQQRRLWA